MEQENIEKLICIVNNRPITGIYPPKNFSPNLKDLLSIKILRKKLIAEGIPIRIFLEANPNTTKWLENLQKNHPHWDEIIKFLLN